MKRRLFLAAALATCASAQSFSDGAARHSPTAPGQPKLLLIIVVDQFRYDYLNRFRSEYNSGLVTLLEKGAVFTNAYYEHFPTVTAIGHSTILSGATPSLSGIVGNEWFDRTSGKNVTSVSDDACMLLGGAAPRRGSSPHRLLVSTVGDELKMANGGQTRVIGMSSKDRSAVLPVGRMADAAYWFDTETGNFVSSTWYMKKLPDWVAQFNASDASEKYAGTSWGSFRRLDAKPGKAYYDALDRTPYHNDLLVTFAEAALDNEKLGQRDVTDVLSVSFSANDRVGHELGPHSPQVRDISIQTDRAIGRLLAAVDKRIGLASVMIIFTADHGVAPMPEFMRERRMPGGRTDAKNVRAAVQEALVHKYGPGDWVVGYSGPAPYLNRQLIREKNLNYEEVQNAAAAAARALPQIFRVYTRSQLLEGRVLDDQVDRRVRNGFHAERSSDLFIVAEPYWLFEAAGTSHGTPWNYDAHVPIILMGPGVKPGRYHGRAAVNDIAPTVATLLNVEVPSGSAGRVLEEALAQ
ncbi:MAG TPA: alkaline phosphatase family protein [Bryobacteraceae bacterium]|nr:alkaline phosphatase family protein [Bryobacteraceae bacterium]